MNVPTITSAEAIKRVEKYGLSDVVRLMLRVGKSGSGEANGYQFMVCEDLRHLGYAACLPCAVYTLPTKDKDTTMVDRFNVDTLDGSLLWDRQDLMKAAKEMGMVDEDEEDGEDWQGEDALMRDMLESMREDEEANQ